MKMMHHEINIRLAEERDAHALVRFNQAMALETEALELDLAVLTAGVENLLKQREHGFYVIAETGAGEAREEVGSLMVTYEWSDWRDGLFWWIQSVYIAPTFRRQGIYRRLYEFVKEQARAKPDVRGFRLYVEKENRTAQLTYEQLGMSQTHYLMFEELVKTKI
jgi:ribosomal protein S18 acetylase RimI-like enzyme